MSGHALLEAVRIRITGTRQVLYRMDVQSALQATGRTRFIETALDEFTAATDELFAVIEGFRDLVAASAANAGLAEGAGIAEIAETYPEPLRSDLLNARQELITLIEDLRSKNAVYVDQLKAGIQQLSDAAAFSSRGDVLYGADGSADRNADAVIFTSFS